MLKHISLSSIDCYPEICWFVLRAWFKIGCLDDLRKGGVSLFFGTNQATKSM
jgi:hypothetical protein